MSKGKTASETIILLAARDMSHITWRKQIPASFSSLIFNRSMQNRKQFVIISAAKREGAAKTSCWPGFTKLQAASGRDRYKKATGINKLFSKIYYEGPQTRVVRCSR